MSTFVNFDKNFLLPILACFQFEGSPQRACLQLMSGHQKLNLDLSSCQCPLALWSTAGVVMSSRSWTLQCHAIELPAFMSPTEVGALKAQPGFVFLYKCHSVHTCLCVNVNCIESDTVMEICLLLFFNQLFLDFTGW